MLCSSAQNNHVQRETPHAWCQHNTLADAPEWAHGSAMFVCIMRAGHAMPVPESHVPVTHHHIHGHANCSTSPCAACGATRARVLVPSMAASTTVVTQRQWPSPSTMACKPRHKQAPLTGWASQCVQLCTSQVGGDDVWCLCEGKNGVSCGTRVCLGACMVVVEE